MILRAPGGVLLEYPSVTMDDVLRVVLRVGMTGLPGDAREAARTLVPDACGVLGSVDVHEPRGHSYGDRNPALSDSCRDSRGRCDGTCKRR